MKYFLLSLVVIFIGTTARNEILAKRVAPSLRSIYPKDRTVHVTVAVASHMKNSFVPGGRILLHITKQREKTPRNKSEITIGFTPADWNPGKPVSFNTKNAQVLTNGFEKLNGTDTGKYYYQVVYKQNMDDGNENVEGNLYSQVDSFDLGQSRKLNLQLSLDSIISPATIISHPHVRTVHMQSKLLTAFSGHSRFLKASVLLPSGYFEDSLKSYPICYRIPGLNGRYNAVNGLVTRKDFADWWFTKEAPQVIYVFLDSQGPYGDTYQVDSENNGPCGQALTEELIPAIEKIVNYNPLSKKRYLAGASTGGWVAMGLQVFYPDFFDGTWSYSPDPLEFSHYGLINIYSDENIFYNRYGYLQPGRRTTLGEPTFSMKDWIKGENVNSRTNDYRVSGGQFGAYNAVFGPKAADGLPSMMFDPITGKIDLAIATQWEKYDLKKVLEKNWSVLGPKLQGKIWIWTGDMDGLYSNVSTRFFKAFLDSTTNPKSDAKISFTPMAGHTQEWNDKAVLTMVQDKASRKMMASNLHTIWLDDLPVKSFSEGIPGILPKLNQGGDSIRMFGKTYTHGIGVASTSILSFLLEAKADSFSATVGVDDMVTNKLPHMFYVLGDGKILFESGAMKQGDQPQTFSVDLKGIQRLGLLVVVKDEGYTKVYSNWADAKINMMGNAVPKSIPNQSEKYILTPASSLKPRINSAPVFGVSPGNPFLYTISATGDKPISFTAINLPSGLVLDRQTGIISGKVEKRGVYSITMKAKNKHGESVKLLKVKVGDTISLTPPMGWNGWNSWARLIDEEKVLASATAMVNMGLKDHGWNYINIDDAWQGNRSGKYNAMHPNEKFPNFKKMIDVIHAEGLKLGVYSTPWITSYAGYIGGSSNFANGAFPDSVKNNKRAFRYIGKYRFEKEDARQLAEWGVDFLKYDWRLEVPSAERMSVALKNSGRDIIYSLSNSAPFNDVKDWVRISNMYRTGPDIRDSWHGLYQTTFTLDKWAPYGGPGHWNDPDMMILGNVTTGAEMHPTRLTPDEQYSHVSLFALLSAPLLIGCPIEQLDAFTLNLLTNDEVIEVDQDPLGKSARLIADEGGVQTWLKPMSDGSCAVGFFNTANYGKSPASYFRWGNEQPKQFEVVLKQLGLKGKWHVRDIWRQRNIGLIDHSFTTTIPHHGVMMFRLIPNK